MIEQTKDTQNIFYYTVRANITLFSYVLCTFLLPYDLSFVSSDVFLTHHTAQKQFLEDVVTPKFGCKQNNALKLTTVP